MPDLYWSQLTVDHVLNFGVLVLMVLMVLGLAVWFVCSIAENTVKMGCQIGHSNYEALLRENERLRDSLADAREANAYLRKLYRDLSPRAEADGERNAA